jgi:hypothetical protein
VPSGSVPGRSDPASSEFSPLPPPSGVIDPSAPATVAPPVPSAPAPDAPSAPVTFGAGGDIAATKALLARLVADAPQLPGNAVQRTAPLRSMADYLNLALDDQSQLVGPFTWSTAPGTVDAAVAYFNAHADPSWHSAGWGTEQSGDGPIVQDIGFSAPDTAYATDVELQIQIAPLADGVGIGLRADALWTPPRPAPETITAPTSVELVVTRGAGPAVDQVLGVAVAARIAGIVNSLQTAPEFSGPMSCPIYPGGDNSDALRFTTATGLTTVTIGFDCRFSYSVAVNGVAEPDLRTTVDLDAVVLKTLGLPTDYGIPAN